MDISSAEKWEEIASFTLIFTSGFVFSDRNIGLNVWGGNFSQLGICDLNVFISNVRTFERYRNNENVYILVLKTGMNEGVIWKIKVTKNKNREVQLHVHVGII